LLCGGLGEKFVVEHVVTVNLKSCASCIVTLCMMCLVCVLLPLSEMIVLLPIFSYPFTLNKRTIDLKPYIRPPRVLVPFFVVDYAAD
jgi:hypothetical protein